jgi:HEAT repeat protein
MGFREFITSRLFRRRLAEDMQRYEKIKPPANPSRRYIDKLVRRLLDARTAWDARKELSMMGSPAVPALSAALNDSRFHETERKDARIPAPLELVLELLVPHGPDQVLSAALPLVNSPSDEVRKTAALQLASLGRAETLPVLVKLLEDSDGYVRSYVRIGVDRALSDGRCNDEFRRGMYEALLKQCDQDWPGTLNDAPQTIVALDPARAVIDFASPRWLSADNPNVYHLLQACNEARLSLPENLVRSLLDHSLPLAVGERCYPHQYVVAAALEALARCIGDRAKPILEQALTSDQEEIQEFAVKGLATLVGLDDPVKFVLDRVHKVGFEGLSVPQRVVYCGFLFDAEVCNGGIMQFFGNSSGDQAIETLEALRVLNHAEAYRALDTAMNLVGPSAREPDRDMRLAAFEDRYDDLQTRFGPLESAYYGTKGLLRQRMLLYAVANAKHFRAESPFEQGQLTNG